jgi:hypothetical protein
MNKLITSIFLLVGQVIFYSCHIPHDREIICEVNFKKAKNLAYGNPNDFSALDSALDIVNRSMQCDSIKTAVVDLKIRLLITLGKYDEGSRFADSLQLSDFTFPYKKTLTHDNFIALNFASKGDTISRDKVYNKMATDLEGYIKQNNLKSKEFQEAFTELSSLQRNSSDSIKLTLLIDSLKIKYPGEERFLDFFKH